MTNNNIVKFNKEKIDLIDKVYINLYTKPIIKNEKYDIEKISNEFNTLKLNYILNEEEKTPEEIYIKMFFDYTKIEERYTYPIPQFDIGKEIQFHLKEISNPNINYAYTDWVSELVKNNNINPKYQNNLINYFNWKKINHNTEKYNPNWDYSKGTEHQRTHCKHQNNSTMNCVDFNVFGKKSHSDENFINDFINNFEIDDFINWINCYNSKLSDLEYDNKIKLRNEQTNAIQVNIDSKLDYYAGREFTLPEISLECDYSQTFNKNDDYFIY